MGQLKALMGQLKALMGQLKALMGQLKALMDPLKAMIGERDRRDPRSGSAQFSEPRPARF